jgi:hypothetical protein
MAAMTPRDPAHWPEASLRCAHCGRGVQETQHTRTSYHVDYYSLHGGSGERCALLNEDGSPAGSYVRLVDRFDVTTCADCYRRAAVRAELERRFRPERALDGEPERA